MEYTVIAVLLTIIAVHGYFARTYSRRIRQPDEGIEKTAVETHAGSELEEIVMDLVRMHSEAKADRTSNHNAIALGSIYVGGLVILTALHHTVGVTPVGWMSLLFLPVPVYMLVRHFGRANVFSISARQSFWGIRRHTGTMHSTRSL